MKSIKLLIVSLLVINLFTDVLSRRHRTRKLKKHKTREDLSDSIKFILGAVSILTRNIYNEKNVGSSHINKECHGVYDDQESIRSLQTAILQYQSDTSDVSAKVFSEALKATSKKFKTQLDKCLSFFNVIYYSPSILEIMEIGSVVDDIMKAKKLFFVKMLAEGHMAFEKIRRDKISI